MIDYSTLIKSWIDYIRLEELSSLKIRKDSVENFRLYKLNTQGSIVASSDSIIRLTFHRKELLEHLANKRESRVENFYLLFPLIEETRVNESFYYPLFIIPFSEEVIKFLKLDVNYSTGAVNSEKECVKDTQQPCEAEWFVREIDLDAVEFLTCKPVFTELLKINEDEYEGLLHGKSLITFLRELLALPDSVSFAEAFAELKEWCKLRLQTLGLKKYKASFFDFIFADGGFELFQNEKIKKQLSVLEDPVYNPQSAPNTAANLYLYGQQQSSFDEYNTPDDSVWCGTFHDFPLSPGQALLLQKYVKGEKLIAVQGPPGTGKTTILMALLAQTLVQRAVSIAEKGVDYSTVMLITSTANKAVENAARDFANNSFLEKFPIYSHGGFYFSYIGGQKSSHFASSMARLERLKNHIEKEDINDTVKEKYKKSKSRLISLYRRLMSRVAEINRLKIEYSGLLQKIKDIESQHPELDKTVEQLSKEISDLKTTMHQEYRYNPQETLQETARVLQSYEIWLGRFKQSRFSQFSYQEMKNLAKSDMQKDAAFCSVYFQNRSLLDRIVNLFTNREQKMIAQFVTSYRDHLEKLGFSLAELYNRKAFFKAVSQIPELCKDLQQWLSSLPDERLFMYAPLPGLLKKYTQAAEKLELLLEAKQKLEELYFHKELLQKHYLFPYTEVAEKVFDLWRTKYYRRTRAMFMLAMEFLYLHALMNKDTVLRCLKLFIQLFSSDSYRAREEIKREGVQNFYCTVSLVCPVYFASLNSSPFIFDKFIYSNGSGNSSSDGMQREFLSAGFKPVHLLFVDEAGMALPHLVYPALFWSERAILVGDPMQLQPVVSLDRNTLDAYHAKFYFKDYDSMNRFSPALTSAYHRAARCETGNPEPSNIGQACFLDYHRRCQAPIANLFCIVSGYRNLFIATPLLKDRDKERLDSLGGKHLIFYDIHGIKGPYKNTNLAEALAIKALCTKLQKSGYDVATEVGIITPYVNQEILLKQTLGDTVPASRIGTIHKFQGSEYPVVIMSTVVFEDNDSTSFIDSSPNLLNVAISRARQLFIMFGSASKLEKHTKYFAKAVDYIKQNGLFLKGIEFDETDERRKNKKALLDYVTQTDQETTLLDDAFAHMSYFKSLCSKVKEQLFIVTPWIKLHNVKNFSYDVIKSLSEKGVRIHIIYGYSHEDQLDREVEALLKSTHGVSLYKMPGLTHAKIILVDSSEVVVGSFNWLSHSYYKYTRDSNETKALIRNEVGVLTKNEQVINKVKAMFNFVK